MGNCQAAEAATVRQDAPGGERRTVRLTRVKLLKPMETLLHALLQTDEHANLSCCVAEVTKAVQARKEEKQSKAQRQLLESRLSKARGAATKDDDETALDASLDP